ncbi:MAG: DUF697 domain-containing protein [Azospirillum sp.]|nr:DUF697 domain-containing protein [Azospirillum sp.]
MTSQPLPPTGSTTGPAKVGASPGAAEGAETAVADKTGESNAAPPEFSEVNGIIKDHVIATMALGLVPVPIFDMVAVVATQLRMTHKLSQAYGVKFVDNVAKSVILSLIGGVVPVQATAVLAAAFFKFVPGIGSFVGGAGVSILSGALTYAIGKVLVQHFESGGTLLDFDPARVRERFKAELDIGKKAAEVMQGEAKKAAA